MTNLLQTQTVLTQDMHRESTPGYTTEVCERKKIRSGSYTLNF